MKTLKKLLCFLLSAMMIFSLVGMQVSATAETAQSLSEENSFIQRAKTAIEKIWNFVFGIIEKIVNHLGIGYSKVDVRNYAEDAFAVPGLDEDFIPQGICYIDSLDKFAVSGYVKGDNSRIYLVDKETGESKKLIISDFTEHAGGIASYGNDVWVSSGGDENEGGFVYHLSAVTLSLARDGAEIDFDGSFQTWCRGSTIFCDGENMIVGEFYERNDYPSDENHVYGKNHAWACGYELPISPLSYNGEKRTPDFIISVPDKVQGLAVSADKNVIFSSSYGRNNDSTLYIYTPYNEWKKTEATIDGETVPLYAPERDSLIAKLKMPTLMEGIDTEQGNLYVVFESGAKNYSDAKEVITQVWDVNLTKISEELN